MSWNPFRRRRDDTVEVMFPASCADCGGVFRDSPGNWHIESQSPGLCNTCHYRVQDRLRRPYGGTKIGF